MRAGLPRTLALRAGRLPHAFDIRARSATGERRLLSITPMLLAGWASEPPLVLHLFDLGPADDGHSVARRAVREEGARAVATESGRDPATAPRAALTDRELQVLRRVAAGRTTEQIADVLDISVHTVPNHVRNVRRKLGARSRLDAVVTAMRQGVLESPRERTSG